MPEAGYIPIPKKLGAKGVTDMVRISDGRMSGTASGAVVLHVAPEAAAGGPLAIIRDGDEIRLNVEERSLILALTDNEINERLAAWRAAGPSVAPPARGYKKLYHERVLQADEGVDFDFLKAV
jgi:dihydroxy-acid dehydratase